MKSIIEGERALCFWLSQQTEVSLYHPDEKARREASDYVSLMTPVVKSLFTDLAMEITSDASLVISIAKSVNKDFTTGVINET